MTLASLVPGAAINEGEDEEQEADPKEAEYPVKYENRRHFYEDIMEHDIIIYDVTNDPKQLSEAMWLAASLDADFENFRNQKIFILLTSLISWLKTKPNDPVSALVYIFEDLKGIYY
ncbi:unnamed protein product [Protopolystoma xenopodis]|uniref:Uncharacterized protein n=1 Tax=Protopolystoma xenopodis TaxID=117903 RepID=A0A448XIJ4_9PLAT|nr:unnamed protein product [Protopolystoma xenopodis]